MTVSDFESLGQPSPSVREVENQDGAVLLDIQQGLCFSINPVGSAIWRMLKEQQTLEQIIDSLVEKFGVPQDQVRADVEEFATLLNQKGLLLPESATPVSRVGLLRGLIHRLKAMVTT